jgi:hypothetical protein
LGENVSQNKSVWNRLCGKETTLEPKQEKENEFRSILLVWEHNLTRGPRKRGRKENSQPKQLSGQITPRNTKIRRKKSNRSDTTAKP